MSGYDARRLDGATETAFTVLVLAVIDPGAGLVQFLVQFVVAGVFPGGAVGVGHARGRGVRWWHG